MKTGAIRFSIDIKVLKDLKKQRTERTVRAAANIPYLTVARGPVPRMPRATVVRDRLSPKRGRGDNLLALQVRKDLHVYST